jgi:hypothetical protein
MPIECLTPEVLLRLANGFRSVAQADAGGPPHGVDLANCVDILDRAREGMAKLQVEQARRGHSIILLIRAVVMGGLLRDAESLRSVCQIALRVATPDDGTSNLYSRLLDAPSAVPGRTSLYIHRLTLYMGYCRWQSALHEKMLAEEGREGIVRWGTMDSSEQGSYDLVYSAFSTLRIKDLPDRFNDALTLIRGAGGHVDAREMDGASDRLSQLSFVPGPPVAVGSGFASFDHKMHATAHSQRLTAPSWSATAALLNSTCTFTGDLGTESKVSAYKSSLLRLFGPWIADADRGVEEADEAPVFDFEEVQDEQEQQQGEQPQQQEQAGEACSFQFEEVQEEKPDDKEQQEEEKPDDKEQADEPISLDEYDLDFTKSIYIAGVLHIVSNITQDLKTALVHFQKFFLWLSAVTRLLTRKASKRRFVATCLGDRVGGMHESQFLAFTQHVHDKRWGTVLDAVEALLQIRIPLVQFWSRGKYESQGRARNDADGDGAEHSVKIADVDAAIRSAWFWAYCLMIACVGEVLQEFSNMSETCPCHRRAFVSRHARRGLGKRKRSDLSNPEGRCPMLTRMAPELAAGEHFRFVRELASKTMMVLLNDELVMNLIDSDRAAILQEFSRARRHIMFNLQLKMSFWLSPPWSHMALGHPDEDVARGEARRSLQRFHAAPPEADHHAVTLELCSPGGRGYDEMSRFAAGAVSREQCPTIIYYAAIFRFATVSERWIEGRHAQAKSNLRSARCHGIVHIAFTGSFTHIRKLVMSPASIDKFAEHCLEVRRPRDAIYACGLNKQPAFRCIEEEVSKAWKLDTLFRAMLVEILFHIDSFTLFQKVGGHDAGDGGGGKQVRPTRKTTRMVRREASKLRLDHR